MSTGGNTVVGTKWKVVANGKASLNGKRHSVTVLGDVMAAEGDESVFDVAGSLVSDIEPVLKRDLVEIDSIQITVFPAGAEEIAKAATHPN